MLKSGVDAVLADAATRREPGTLHAAASK
jgi:hypothetical protein